MDDCNGRCGLDFEGYSLEAEVRWAAIRASYANYDQLSEVLSALPSAKVLTVA